MPISLFVGVPIVAICYLLVNVAFFLVLSYDKILMADAVALVSRFGVSSCACECSIVLLLHVHVCVHVYVPGMYIFTFTCVYPCP